MSFGIFRDLMRGSRMLLILESVFLLGDQAQSERLVCCSLHNVPGSYNTAPEAPHSHEAGSLLPSQVGFQ